MLTIENMARVVHDVNRAFHASYGLGQPLWDDLTPEGQEDLIQCVFAHIEDDDMSVMEVHDAVFEALSKDGWTLGPPDREKKQRPDCAPWSELHQQWKTHAFIVRGTIFALAQENFRMTAELVNRMSPENADAV